MSKYSSHAVTVSSGCDIVKCIQDFATAQSFLAASVVQCVGEVSRATLRMAESWSAYEPVKEVSDLAKIESFVGTISGDNGHLHASLSHKDGKMIGGHVFGPLVASGDVKIVVGECRNLLFTRTHDERTGFPELVVLDRESNSQIESQKPISQGEVDLTAEDLTIKAYAFRLVPGEEICNGLNNFVSKHNLKEPFIMTCVGSVTKAVIGLGQDKTEVLTMEGHFEIVSLLGTPKNLQISLSDKDGHVTTGHVTGELIVFTTAELVLGEKISE